MIVEVALQRKEVVGRRREGLWRELIILVSRMRQERVRVRVRVPSKKPGAWAGSICLPVPGVGLFVTVSQEKWDKRKDIHCPSMTKTGHCLLKSWKRIWAT